jgi:quinol-cytochrome oxidoreductase complex cytochrome b subunit
MEKESNNRAREFYPYYLSEILIVIFLTLGIVFVLAMLFPPSIGREINFIAAYQPKPEWYFLWLYQMVKYFPGKWAFVGTIIIPLFTITSLFYIPFIDCGTIRTRRIVTVWFILLFGGFLILTLVPLLMP